MIYNFIEKYIEKPKISFISLFLVNIYLKESVKVKIVKAYIKYLTINPKSHIIWKKKKKGLFEITVILKPRLIYLLIFISYYGQKAERINQN